MTLHGAASTVGCINFTGRLQIAPPIQLGRYSRTDAGTPLSLARLSTNVFYLPAFSVRAWTLLYCSEHVLLASRDQTAALKSWVRSPVLFSFAPLHPKQISSPIWLK